MCSLFIRKRVVRIILASLVLALLAGGSIWWMNRSVPTSPTLSNATNMPGTQELAIQPFSAILEPITQAALSRQTRAELAINTVQPQVAVMNASHVGSPTPEILFPIFFISIVVLGIALIAFTWGRRSRITWLSTILLVVLLTVGTSSPALAGAGTLTRWFLPHTFSDFIFAPAKDAPNGYIYFAEHMIAGAPSLGRIGQLNLTTNDLVEWPTTGVLGTSMTVVGSNVFFTEPLANIIGKLEPSTNNFTRWQLPTAGGDALIFWVDGSSNVWYFSLNAAKIGRLNPSTNDITEWVLASAGTAIKFFGRDTASGLIWFSIPAEAKIGRLDLTTNQITMWTVPTEKVSVLAVSDNSCWFGGVKDLSGSYYYTAHVGRLDVNSNQVTCWTIVPTDTPGTGAYDFGYWPEVNGYPQHEIDVATGRCRQLGVVDSSGKPWFLVQGTMGSKLTRLDPVKNQLLEFDFNAYTMVDIDVNGVINALYRMNTNYGYVQDTVVYFNTMTNSETRFVLPWPPTNTGTWGLLRLSPNEFWLTRSANFGYHNAIVEHLVIVP